MIQPLEGLQASLEGRYTVLREVGRGGMATVYLAEDCRHARPVALKVLRPEIAQSLGAARFLREIEIASQLQHPHILGLHDSGLADEGTGQPVPYYTMPFVEGESLRARLDRETYLPLDEALRIVREVAEAVDYAHARGLVHRDIKPENILFSEGHAVVADFGIAKATTAADQARLTETGLALGTPHYMSPEQAAGTTGLDGRTDIYALGCVLYEMLAGQPPFTGPTAQAIVARHLVDPVPSLHTVRDTVPLGVEHAITRAMAKIPADRFPTARAFVEALERTEPEPTPAGRRRMVRVGAVAASFLGLLVTFGIWVARGRSTEPAGLGAIRSLAVLPIENLTGDTTQLYVADAVTDQFITDLAQIRSVKVIARTSVMGYRGTTKTTREIARELGVDVVLTGALQRVGEELRISAQLSSGATGQALWARSYDGVVRDILRLQSAVAQAVTQQIRVTLTTDEQGRLDGAPREVDPAAYDAYVKGRYWWNRRGEPNLRTAVGFFQRALELDPTYAAAYSGLADSYVQLGYGGYDAPAQAFPRVKAAATRALELDPRLAEPHASLGFYSLYYEWDWAAAEREFQTAFSLNPNYATAHEWYSLFLAAMGRLEEAQRQVRLASELDPLSVPIASTAGWIAHYSGKQEEAERRLRDALTMDSLYPIAHLYLGRVYQAQGQYDAALAEYQRLGPLLTWVPTVAGMGSVEAAMGRRRGAEQVLAHLDSIGRTRYVTAYGIALVHTALGDNDQAFAYLDRAVEERTHWLVWLNRDFRWAPLRADRRFRDLVRRVGLPS